jgi:CheY-like chemotaxis protein
MDSLPILVLDYENRSQGCNSFLLQLAGFSVTKVTNIAEALNWSTYRQDSTQPFALLAASNLPDDEILRTIRLLHQAGVTLPLLLVNRDISPACDTRCEPSALGTNVFFCRPEEIGQAARQITNSEVAPCLLRQRGDIAIDI